MKKNHICIRIFRLAHRLWSKLFSSGLMLVRHCSVQEAGCLSSPALVLESWRIPGQLPLFSVHLEVGSEVSEGPPQWQDRGQLNEGKSAERKASFFPVLFRGLPPEGVAQI